MSENKIIKIGSYTPKSSDVFLFDNNIWMYLFCPLAGFQKDKKQRVYSNFFSSLLSRKLPIYINSLILSEFSNRYLRLDYDLCNKNTFPLKYKLFKKDYVGSPQYVKTTSDVKSLLNQIMSVCQKCSDEFNSINIPEVFNLFEKIGFNDSYYMHLAKLKNWIIVSDDSDMIIQNTPQIGITILTF
jgi:hypothetical protein